MRPMPEETKEGGAGDATAAEGQALRKATAAGSTASADSTIATQLQQLQGNITKLTELVASQQKTIEQYKSVDPEQIKKAAADAAKSVLSDQQTRQAIEQKRRDFAAEKLKGLPAVYGSRLGDDPAKWEAEAQAIAEQAKTELAAAGLKPADVGGRATGGTPPKSQVDVSKLSGTALITEGIKRSTPERAGYVPADRQQTGQQSAA